MKHLELDAEGKSGERASSDHGVDDHAVTMTRWSR
jgi:hypothetical protein